MTSARSGFAALCITAACGGRARNSTTDTSAIRARAAEPAAPAALGRVHAESAYVAALRTALGADAELSLVPELQAASESALLAERKPGAVVLLDPNDGRVLAVFSVPGDRGDPLVTPAQPNSTFKSFTAVAALTDGVVTPTSVHHCSGRYPFAGVTLICPAEHGDEDVRRALAVSCNSFFYDTGSRLDVTHLAAVARAFGLDQHSGLELAEGIGSVPAPADDAHPVRPLLDAIGHGAYTVTLLGLARAYAAIANGGRLPSLHLVDAHRRGDGVLVPSVHSPPEQLPFAASTFELVRSGLADDVGADYGKAHAFALQGYPFAGKPGGGDSPPRAGEPPLEAEQSLEKDTWFVAYAPPTRPTLLVAARLERARDGRVAANVVSRVLARVRELSP